MTIDTMSPEDWPAVRAIYAEGIATGNATFETEPPEWAVWDAKTLPEVRYVARVEGRVAGWAGLSRVSPRQCYRGVCEVSVYVGAASQGSGIGGQLMEALIRGSEEAGVWTMQASIFPENQASVRLHERHGFRMVGRRERIARLNGIWRDTLLLERRSSRMT